jgi:hypothetical protein
MHVVIITISGNRYRSRKDARKNNLQKKKKTKKTKTLTEEEKEGDKTTTKKEKNCRQRSQRGRQRNQTQRRRKQTKKRKKSSTSSYMSEPEPMQQRQKKNTHTLMTMSLPKWCSQEKERKAFCPGSVLSPSLPPPRNNNNSGLSRLLLLQQQLPPSLCPFLCLLVPAQAQAPRVVPSAAPRCVVVVVGGAPRPGSDRTRPARGWASPSTGHRGGRGAGGAGRRAGVNQTQQR